jgi:hypothetical protein
LNVSIDENVSSDTSVPLGKNTSLNHLILSNILVINGSLFISVVIDDVVGGLS